MEKFSRLLVPTLFFATPFIALAGAAETIITLVGQLGSIVSSLIPIMTGIAILAFFWGLAKYVFAAGDESRKAEGKNIMLWGGIALFVMFSIYGIIRTVQSSLSLSTADTGAISGTGLSPI